ncbi:SMI1/KNR4 family protein [Emticicia sp.]|uniref:SMI1/KNR4 family protein n=1 Tax=Emticicia sp. TaxID=1930953 RepID=UPI00374FED18
MQIDNEIIRFEDKFSLKLPKSYKDFLSTNKKKMVSCTFSVHKSYFINHFYQIENTDLPYTLEEINVNLWEDPHIFPAYCIAIGTDSFGNFYCIDLSSSNYGQVFFFDTEFYDEEDNKFTTICKAFEEFKEHLF